MTSAAASIAPPLLMRIRAGLDGEGRLAAWDAARAGSNITPETIRNSLLP